VSSHAVNLSEALSISRSVGTPPSRDRPRCAIFGQDLSQYSLSKDEQIHGEDLGHFLYQKMNNESEK
jgi:hypothetical protein